jgi:hypothetical protein
MKIDSITFKEENGAMLLNLASDFIVPKPVVEYSSKNGFGLLSDLHITIIGNKEGKNIIPILNVHKIKMVKDMIEKMDWSFELSNHFFHLKKDYGFGPKESLIQEIKISKLEDNLRSISELINHKISLPFLHITYAIKNSNDGLGIGINTIDDFNSIDKKEIQSNDYAVNGVNKIYIPSRLQVDTSIGIFLLKKFGQEQFPGIERATIQVEPILDNTKSEDIFLSEGIFLLDVGGGSFDHHRKDFQTTCSFLLAKYLGIDNDKSISKLLAFADRDDATGKGIISNDMIDKSFGLPGLIVSLNRTCDNDPNKVYKVIEPLLEAHYRDEYNSSEGLPKEIEQKKKENDFYEFSTTYRGRHIRVCMTTSDDSTMTSYLRSKRGGDFDVVAMWRKSGHINILTKQFQKFDLRSLAALIRKSEAMLQEIFLDDMDYLSSPQRIDEVQNWYYDTATNSIQNGGITPTKNIYPTKIPKESMVEILKLGLSETLWKPEK